MSSTSADCKCTALSIECYTGGCSNHTLPRGEIHWVLHPGSPRDFQRVKPVGNLEDVGNVKPNNFKLKAVGSHYLIIGKVIQIWLFFISLCTDSRLMHKP